MCADIIDTKNCHPIITEMYARVWARARKHTHNYYSNTQLSLCYHYSLLYPNTVIC
jgi:hypothetical protein